MAVTSMSLAGLELRVVEGVGPVAGRPAPVVLLLHGFSMRADDLAPFGASLGLPALFLFPEGPISVPVQEGGGRAWWMIDTAARDAAMDRQEDRDLSAQVPAGLTAARTQLNALVEAIVETWPGCPMFLGGFSQGAILSLDLVLRTGRRPAGLVLLSGAQVDADATSPALERVRGLPVFQSHGHADRELSYRAATALRDRLAGAGAVITWLGFEGGHEIPLPVLRALKKFIQQATAPPVPPTEGDRLARPQGINGRMREPK